MTRCAGERQPHRSSVRPECCEVQGVQPCGLAKLSTGVWRREALLGGRGGSDRTRAGSSARRFGATDLSNRLGVRCRSGVTDVAHCEHADQRHCRAPHDDSGEGTHQAWDAPTIRTVAELLSCSNTKRATTPRDPGPDVSGEPTDVVRMVRSAVTERGAAVTGAQKLALYGSLAASGSPPRGRKGAAHRRHQPAPRALLFPGTIRRRSGIPASQSVDGGPTTGRRVARLRRVARPDGFVRIR